MAGATSPERESKTSSTGLVRMIPEPLIPLARAVAYEVTSLEEKLGVKIGTVRLAVVC